MAEESNQVFYKYQNTGAKTLPTSNNEPLPTQIKIENVTQEMYSWGAISQVYLSAESPRLKKKKESRFSDVSLVLRRIVTESHGKFTHETTQLEIQSVTLRNAFKRLAEGFVNINLHGDPITIPNPYVELYHCRRQLQEAIDCAPNESIREELELLQQFQEDHMSQDLKELQTLESNGYITVAFLPLIFVPGSLVLIPNRLAGSKEVFCAAVVEVCKLIEENQKKFWYVRLAYTNFDNVQFGATSTKAQYPQFDDVKHILDLPVFPMKYHPNRDQIYQSLLERGSRCKQLHLESSPFIGHGSRGASGTHWEYDGPFWSILSGGGLSPGRSETEEGRSCINIFQGFPTSLCQGKIIIDPNSLIKENPGCREVVQKAKSGPISIMWKAETTSSHDLDTSKSKPPYQQFSNNEHQANSLTDLQLITMAPILAGFSLTRRSWGFFLVDNIADIRWNDDSYGNLQIDQSRKDIIYEVVKEHRKAPVALDNVVAGKGAGLIFLLHGPPGSGKTMTAECVAESLHCPLYHTTMGELGPNVKAIEEQLQITFTRIQQWSAILLFDEADAFMAERSENDLERNALVSGMLYSRLYLSKRSQD
ncbi:hypothetical protein FPSE_05407 [Fusarium pseudograminearum CS3096]|uniref:AAA+ ATPase domain-containing protein n=1 Tax=Fusarium pseudograminearum (strain CS3096) TaxID=1028729 RepID=K3W0M3_FUSPC|nr:hypothetical protein FPSE_05407 [Fusarium pseudograminearum CS3096]EKJ74400.1 hypothetical protein FPSE_05407 [Fusarium pseudograminearum CS3096]